MPPVAGAVGIRKVDSTGSGFDLSVRGLAPIVKAGLQKRADGDESAGSQVASEVAASSTSSSPAAETSVETPEIVTSTSAPSSTDSPVTKTSDSPSPASSSTANVPSTRSSSTVTRPTNTGKPPAEPPVVSPPVVLPPVVPPPPAGSPTVGPPVVSPPVVSPPPAGKPTDGPPVVSPPVVSPPPVAQPSVVPPPPTVTPPPVNNPVTPVVPVGNDNNAAPAPIDTGNNANVPQVPAVSVVPSPSGIALGAEVENTVTLATTDALKNAPVVTNSATVVKTLLTLTSLSASTTTSGSVEIVTSVPVTLTTEGLTTIQPDPSSTSAGSTSASSASNKAVIAGAVSGGIAFIVMILFTLLFIRRRRARNVPDFEEFKFPPADEYNSLGDGPVSLPSHHVNPTYLAPPQLSLDTGRVSPLTFPQFNSPAPSPGGLSGDGFARGRTPSPIPPSQPQYLDAQPHLPPHLLRETSKPTVPRIITTTHSDGGLAPPQTANMSATTPNSIFAVGRLNSQVYGGHMTYDSPVVTFRDSVPSEPDVDAYQSSPVVVVEEVNPFADPSDNYVRAGPHRVMSEGYSRQ